MQFSTVILDSISQALSSSMSVGESAMIRGSGSVQSCTVLMVSPELSASTSITASRGKPESTNSARESRRRLGISFPAPPPSLESGWIICHSTIPSHLTRPIFI